jgi:hypothetical protein
MSDESRRARARLDDDDRARARTRAAPAGGAPCLVARTKVKLHYPTVANAYYACESMAVLGTETEGGPASATSSGDTYFAYNLGSAVPPQGTPVVTVFIGHRWVFRYS